MVQLRLAYSEIVGRDEIEVRANKSQAVARVVARLNVRQARLFHFSSLSSQNQEIKRGDHGGLRRARESKGLIPGLIDWTNLDKLLFFLPTSFTKLGPKFWKMFAHFRLYRHRFLLMSSRFSAYF